jgi:triacylglycerol lipase
MSPRDYAMIAQEAYTAVPDIGVASSASRAIVRQTADGLVIAFRGSDDEDSWLTDFDIDLVDVDGAGRLHKGFWNAWQVIASEVEAVTASQPVTFVGHSLGAALAVVAAVAFKLASKPVSAVYGFEPPRVTPDLGVRTLLQDVPVHLYRNGLDVVTDVPVDWQHAALLIHIGTPELPFVNTLDHDLKRVINALT